MTGRYTQSSFPVSLDSSNNVCLLSGYSAELLKVLMENPEDISPLKMLTLALHRYNTLVVVDESDIGSITTDASSPECEVMCMKETKRLRSEENKNKKRNNNKQEGDKDEDGEGDKKKKRMRIRGDHTTGGGSRGTGRGRGRGSRGARGGGFGGYKFG